MTDDSNSYTGIDRTFSDPFFSQLDPATECKPITRESMAAAMEQAIHDHENYTPPPPCGSEENPHFVGSPVPIMVEDEHDIFCCHHCGSVVRVERSVKLK